MRERKRILTTALLALVATASSAAGQDPTRLTLQDAIDLARGHNPTFQATQNDEAEYDWGLREAVTSLFVPRFDAFGQAAYRAPGVSRIGTINTGGVEEGALYTSFYQLQATLSIDGNTIFGVSSAKADRQAARARTRAAEFDLESLVTFQYMTALRARDQVEVAHRQVERSMENLESVGLDIGGEVELVSEFRVFEPTWTDATLISWALESHPSLHALVASEGARKANLRQAQSSYFPTFALQADWSGFTQEIENGEFLVRAAERGVGRDVANCELFNRISTGLSTSLPGFPRDCTVLGLSSDDRDAILASNGVFPFSFTHQPLRARINVSIPIFTGFSRERQASEAANAYEDAVHLRRAEELRLRTAVTSAHDGLTTAHTIVQVEERNRIVAAEQLELARARYRLGADHFLVLLDAERTMAEAERAYLDAIYTFHVALANLENAVGRRLRPPAQEPTDDRRDGDGRNGVGPRE